jgi:hypothetical protein
VFSRFAFIGETLRFVTLLRVKNCDLKIGIEAINPNYTGI